VLPMHSHALARAGEVTGSERARGGDDAERRLPVREPDREACERVEVQHDALQRHPLMACEALKQDDAAGERVASRHLRRVKPAADAEADTRMDVDGDPGARRGAGLGVVVVWMCGRTSAVHAPLASVVTLATGCIAAESNSLARMTTDSPALMSLQLAPFWSQLCHWNVIRCGMPAKKLPTFATSASPTCGVPEMVGRALNAGAFAAEIRSVVFELGGPAVPAELLAETKTAIERPTSACVNV